MLISGSYLMQDRNVWPFDTVNFVNEPFYPLCWLFIEIVVYQLTVWTVFYFIWKKYHTPTANSLRDLSSWQRSSLTDPSKLSTYADLLKELNDGVPPAEVQAKFFHDVKFCINENSIFDISTFKHPGGQYIATKIYGRDVGRFITGSYHLEEYAHLPAYTHSPQTWSLLNRYKIGDINDDAFRICQRSKHANARVTQNNMGSPNAGSFRARDSSKNSVTHDRSAFNTSNIEMTETMVRSDTQGAGYNQFGGNSGIGGMHGAGEDDTQRKLNDQIGGVLSRGNQVQEWEFLEMEPIGQDTFIYTFQSKNGTHYIKNWMKGTRWLSRHFMINFADNPRACRLYTTIQSYSRENRKQLKSLLHYYHKLRHNETDFDGTLHPLPLEKNGEEMIVKKISFVIKTYTFRKPAEGDQQGEIIVKPTGSLSYLLHQEFFEKHQDIHGSNNTDEFASGPVMGGRRFVNIRGPFGLGISMPENATGHYVIICGGTGILPFLDLFFLLLKKSAYQYFDEKDAANGTSIGRLFKSENYTHLFRDKSSEGKAYGLENNSHGMDYDHHDHHGGKNTNKFGAKFTFYGAFRSDADFYGREIIDNLYKIGQETGNGGFFNGLAKISKRNDHDYQYSIPTTKERFTEKFFRSQGISAQNQADRYLICGPPRMMQGTPVALKACGVDPNRIELV